MKFSIKYIAAALLTAGALWGGSGKGARWNLSQEYDIQAF